MSIEAMKQALDVLENTARSAVEQYVSEQNAITALRQAIEQAEKQQALDKKADNARELGLDYEPEPVAWMTNSEQDVTAEFLFSHVQTPMHNIPLYTAPPMTPEHLPQYIATDGKPMESGGGGVCSHPRKKWVGLTDDDLRQIILVSIGVAEAKLKVKNGV